jgi:hypothetical protein
MKTLAAAVVYFLIVFGTGFLVGPVRVLYVEPRLGTTAAVLLEAPILLVAMAIGARIAVRFSRVTKSRVGLLAIGLIGLLLQQGADIAFGVLLRGITVVDHFAQFATAPGMVYATLLAVFLFMPWLFGRRRDTTSR